MKFIQTILLFTLLLFNLQAKDLQPQKQLEASGGVTDLVISNNQLYVATTGSSVDVFDLTSFKQTNQYKVPQIKDFVGDIIDAKIYSVDVLNNQVLMVSQGEKGGRNIDVFIEGQKHNIISDKKRYFIAKAKFVDKQRILFSLLSNQLYMYDIKSKKRVYAKQISQSKFSDFVLDEEKKRVIVTDESGDIHLIDVSNGTILETYSNQNLDNVFQLDWKQGTILTAGQDRRCVVYDEKGHSYFRKSGFLIYSCGLSPSGKRGGYSSDEENNVLIFDTVNNKTLAKLTRNNMTLTKMLFKSESEIFVASDDKIVNYYKID